MLAAAWDGPDKTAFDTFVAGFVDEVRQTAQAVSSCQSALDDVADALGDIQNTALVQVGTTSAAIIFAQAMVMVPFVGIAFEVIKEALGAVVSAEAATTVTIVGAFLLTTKDFLLDTASTTFAGDAPEPGGDIDFVDVELDVDFARA